MSIASADRERSFAGLLVALDELEAVKLDEDEADHSGDDQRHPRPGGDPDAGGDRRREEDFEKY